MTRLAPLSPFVIKQQSPTLAPVLAGGHLRADLLSLAPVRKEQMKGGKDGLETLTEYFILKGRLDWTNN